MIGSYEITGCEKTGGKCMKTNDEALLKIKYDVLRTVSKLAFEGKLE